jgi:hypothetical protein
MRKSDEAIEPAAANHFNVRFYPAPQGSVTIVAFEANDFVGMTVTLPAHRVDEVYPFMLAAVEKWQSEARPTLTLARSDSWVADSRDFQTVDEPSAHRKLELVNR